MTSFGKIIKVMRAIVVENFGKLNVLQIKDVEVPKYEDNEVLIKIKYAGVNPVDTYIREGAYLNLPELPYTPGKDGAGIVEAVGKSVQQFKPGNRVFVCNRKVKRYGTYAEYTVADSNDVFLLDERLTFEEGAALGIPYFTAFRALILKGKAVAGETVLIHGASGAVGLAAVQIAKQYKLTGIGTAGTEEGMKLVKENGADHVFCHKSKNYLQSIEELTQDKGVDIIIEMLANVNLDKDLSLLGNRGRVLVVGCRGSISINPRLMMGPETQVIGIALLNSTDNEWAEITKSVLCGIKNGWIKPIIDKKYPLDSAAQSHNDVIHSKGAKGKLVLSVECQ